MQRGIGGLLAWLITIFIYITNQGKSKVEADALSQIDWEKCDETIQANSIQAIVAAAIADKVANHIEAVPCSPQTIDFFLPSIPDILIISRAFIRLSKQSCLTHPESESSIMKTVSKLDDPSGLEVANNHQLNPKCITKLDWVEAQSKDKTIDEIIQLFKAK